MPRSRPLALVALIVAVVAIGGFVVYDQVLRGDSADALTLPTAAPTSSASSAASTPTSGASSTPVTSAAPAASPDASVAGTWTVASGSQAGYRVREQLASLPAESDAVGRTDKITGSITLETNGATTTLTAATITVDTTSIASDESRRDNRLRSEGLQTDQFPTATFTLTQPVEVPAAALTGTPSDITLTGDLELHGVTKSVRIPAQAQLVDGVVQVAGSLTFPLSDFDIVAPNIGGFIVSIADDGTLEFLASFARG
jgi:polyisoprenoid-binding protein YceI